MSDPLSIASSILAVVSATIASTRVLSETIRRFQNHDRTLQQLKCELDDLLVVLDSLEDMPQPGVSKMTFLKGPVTRCSQLCLDFDKSINELTGQGKTSSRDWATLKLRRDDIHDFIRNLSGYRSVITISLRTTSLHVTPHLLKECLESIESTQHDINLHLQRINEKIAGFSQKTNNDTDATIDLNHKRAVLEGCLHICEDVSTDCTSLMEEKTVLHSEEPSEQAMDQHEHFEVQNLVRQDLSKDKDRITEMVGRLQEQLDSLPLDRSYICDDERTSLQQVLDIWKQRLDMYKVASDEGVWENENMPRKMAGGMYSDENLFTAIANSTLSSASFRGHMTDETLKRLAESRYSSSFEALPSTDATVRRYLDNDQHQKGNSPSQQGTNHQQMMAESPETPTPYEVRRRTTERLGRVGGYRDPLIFQTTPSQSEAAPSLWDHAYEGMCDGSPQPASRHEEVISTELAKHATAVSRDTPGQDENLGPIEAQKANEPLPTNAQTSVIEDLSSSSSASHIFSKDSASTKPSSKEDLENDAGYHTTKQKAETFYNHKYNKYPFHDIDDEIVSIASDSEDIHSQNGSSMAHFEVRQAAASYLADMLASHPSLGPLYEDACARLEDARFLRNHERLLKSYYLFLLSQAPNRKHRMAIDFLRPRSHRRLISSKILGKINPGLKMGRERVHVMLPQDDERNLLLERFLNNIEDHSGDKSIKNDETIRADDNQSEEGSSEDGHEEEYDQRIALVDLENTRSYFISGKPLAQFKAKFRDFLNPSSKGIEKTQKEAQSIEQFKRHRLNNGSRWTTKMYCWLVDRWFPPQPGYERIRYTCACGANMFLDVQELNPGGLQRFRQRLAKDGLANLVPAQDSVPNDQDSLSLPPSAHLRPERSQSIASTQSSELGTALSRQMSTTPTSDTSWSEEETSVPAARLSPQYLLVCVNQKSLPTLDHVECSSFENDEYLFRQILETYRATREGSVWKISFLFPMSMRRTIQRTLTFLELNTPKILNSFLQSFMSLSEISFFKMGTANYVQFELVPVGEITIPNVLKQETFPPSSEVDAGNYLYEPVPKPDVAIKSIPLWHLTQPGQHSDKYWISTFPKKLTYPLRRELGVYGKPTIGWGIQINECLNWTHLLFVILTAMVTIGIVVIIYVVLKADESSAFGLGAFLVAIVAAYIPYQYLSWAERTD